MEGGQGKKNCTYVRESGQIIKYKLISVLISVFGAMNCIWKIKKDMTAAPRSPPCNLLAESSKREVGGEENKGKNTHWVNMAAWIFFVLFFCSLPDFGMSHIRVGVPFGKCGQMKAVNLADLGSSVASEQEVATGSRKKRL